MKLILSGWHPAMMSSWCEMVAPDEGCGLLLGTDTGTDVTVDRVWVCDNIHPSPATNFEADPTQVEMGLRNAARTGIRVVGGFHSHPNGDGRPSRTDQRRAPDDRWVTVILDPAGRLRAWTRAHGELDIQVRPVPSPVASPP